MSKTVKAAVVEAPGKIGFRELPYPKLEYGDGGAVMKSIASGICGTDKHTFKGETKQNTGTATAFEAAPPAPDDGNGSLLSVSLAPSEIHRKSD